MKTIGKTIGLCILAMTATACSEDNEGPDAKGSAECSYQITIEGKTTLPNEFGLDRIVLTGGSDGEGVEAIAFTISQAKVGSDERSFLVALVHGLLNRELPEGTYPVNSLATPGFDTPEYQQYPLYVTGDPGDDHYEDENVTFTLLENSEDRIRMKISGNLLKLDEVEGELVEVGRFPVEAEITMGRKYYVETLVEGTMIGGAVCDCQV